MSPGAYSDGASRVFFVDDYETYDYLVGVNDD